MARMALPKWLSFWLPLTVKATAHKLACLVYRMLKYGQEYVTQSMEEYKAKMETSVLNALKRKAAAMGYQLNPLPAK